MRLRIHLASILLMLCPLSVFGQDAAAKEEEKTKKPTKADAHKAESSFKRALRFQAKPEETDNLNHALEALGESHELNPTEPTYATTYEFVKQQLIAAHMEKGDRLLQ